MSAALIARLVAENVSPELIADIADALADARAAQRILDKRRAADRERKAVANPRIPRNSTEAEESAEFHGETPFPAPAPSFPPDPQTNPTPTHTPVDDTPRARKAEPFPRPEWAPPDIWQDFLKNRRKKNLPNTATAHRKFLADVERLTDNEWPPGRLLEAAVGRGWGAIYEGCKDDDGRQANRGSGGPGAQRMGGPRADPLLAIRRAAGAAAARSVDDRV